MVTQIQQLNQQEQMLKYLKLQMVIDGSICTLYLRHNKQTFYQQILWQFQQTQLLMRPVDGEINVIKIKTAEPGGADGTHTGIAIRGDGSGGVCSVTVTSGAVTAVTITSKGTGYTFGTVSNAQIVAAQQV